MVENMDNFNRAQKKHPQLHLDFDHFIEVLIVNTFPTLQRAWFKVARTILNCLAKAQPNKITFVGLYT